MESTTKRNLSVKFLLLLAFSEGAAVMTAEVISARALAPVFGTSLYVWAAVLGVTLLSLTLGYYLGGVTSKKEGKRHMLFYVLLVASILLLLMPQLAHIILKNTIDWDVRVGSTFSLLLFLLPPLMLMGMSSPLIIENLAIAGGRAGNSAGKVYAISTAGGIFSTFFTGFYLLPEHGVKTSVLFFSIPLLILSVLGIVKSGKKWAYLFLLLPLFFLKSPKEAQSANIKIVTQSEGILGQVKVVDQYYNMGSRGMVPGRSLVVNNTLQTITDLTNPQYDLWQYSFFLPAAASIFPKGSDALIIGMGGGTTIKQFKRLGFNVDAVDLDKRVMDAATRYFDLDRSNNLFVDDGRHFLNVKKKEYDVILFDVFLSETPPSHLFSKECFEQVKYLLSSNGLFIINFYGFIKGEMGVASRSIFKTLKASGFNVELLSTPGDSEVHKNTFFLASETDLDFSKASYREPNSPAIEIKDYLVNTKDLDLENAFILTDESTKLERLYVGPALEWRRETNKNFALQLIREDIRLFR